MIWQNPWAWLGLLALGIPLLIHLLGRRNARITRFPTLRFVEASRLMATRRTRLSDLALLAVRMGIIAAAVAALAMPLLLTPGRQRARPRGVARAIIVDTSRSMQRLARGDGGAEEAIAQARRVARLVASEAGTSVILETATPSSALAGAVGWLATQRGRPEVVVISDFQIAAIDSVDVAMIPANVGVDLRRVRIEPDGGTIELAAHQGTAELIARITVDSARTNVEWIPGGVARARGSDSLVILVRKTEQAAADAAREAARSVAIAGPSTGRPIAVVYVGAPEFDGLLRAAKPPSLPWQGDVIARLRADPLLAEASLGTDLQNDVVSEPGPGASPLIAVARHANGRAVVLATTAIVNGSDRVVLVPVAAPGSLLSAAVIAAAMRAATDAPIASELEPSTIPEQTLASWRRTSASGSGAAGANDDASDGRWLWVLALALLALETWMRRARREPSAQEMVHDRAA